MYAHRHIRQASPKKSENRWKSYFFIFYHLIAYWHLYFPEAGVQVQILGHGHGVLQAQGEDGEHEPHA